MNKEENFIVMGVLIGTLLLIVVVLSLVLKPFNTKLVDRAVVRDDETVDVKEEENIEEDYIEVRYTNTHPSVTKNFDVQYSKTKNTKDLMYQTKYISFYVIGTKAATIKIIMGNNSYMASDAINQGMITIYDLIDNLGSQMFISEERYNMVLGSKINDTISIGSYNLIYEDGNEIYINFDNLGDETLSDMLKYDMGKSDFNNLLRYLTGEGEAKAYKLKDNTSYMFEYKSNRIFICNNDKNNNIYVGNKQLNLSCD